MGKVTFHGSSRSYDEIPQPTSILMGANLRSNSDAASNKQKPPTLKPKPKKQPPKK